MPIRPGNEANETKLFQAVTWWLREKVVDYMGKQTAKLE